MSDPAIEARALFRSLAELPGDPYTPFVAEYRSKFAAATRAALTPPTADMFQTAKRDLNTILSLADPAERAAAIAVWNTEATQRLGRLAEAAHLRAAAEADPGRDRTIGLAVAQAAGARGDELAKQVRDDLVDHAWIAGCQRAASAVGYVQVPRYFGTMKNGWADGTIFAIGGDLVMTAYHVVQARDRARGEPPPTDAERARQVAESAWSFDYLSKPTPPLAASLTTGATLVWHHEALDVAVLRLSQLPPATVTPVHFHDAALPAVDGGIAFVANIVQHPNGEPKKLGLRNNAVWRIDPDKLLYFTDTRGGSSGAPVFNDQWAVIAVHTGWDSVAASKHSIYMGRMQAFANRGARSTSILAAIRGDAAAAAAIPFTVAAP